MIYYVYIYLREDGSPYYVGKGKHNRWKEPHNVEIPPNERVIFPVTNTTEDWSHFIEMELIDFYGRLNDGTGILENLTDGGEGCSGRIHTEETKRKIGEANRVSGSGKKHSEETKQKMSNAKKGKPKSKEHKENISKAKKGKSMSEETKQKLRVAMKGKIPNRKGAVLSEETKQKMSNAKKGKSLSEETKQKLKESWIRRKSLTNL